MGAAFSPLPKYIILEELPLSLTGLALADLVQHGGSFWCLLYQTLTGNMNTVSPAGPEGGRMILSYHAGMDTQMVA